MKHPIATLCLTLALGAALLATACAPLHQGPGLPDDGTGPLITTQEQATLPAWQQELLDEGGFTAPPEVQ